MNKTQKLRDLAQQLPRIVYTNEAGMPREIQRTMLGQSLIDRGINEIDGKPVIADKKYGTMMPHYVDHYSELKSILRSNGWHGVLAYVNKVNALEVAKTTKPDPEIIKTPITNKKAKERPTFWMRLKAAWSELMKILRRGKK